MKKLSKSNQTLLIVFGLLLVLGLFGYFTMGQTSFVRTSLSGLTLGALYFMVAAGLTLVFGLMDVLNFAHGTTFMLGAYMGWQFFTNPSFLFGVAPLVFAFLAGISASSVLQVYVTRWHIEESKRAWIQRGFIGLALVVGLIGVWGVDFLALAETAMVAITFTTNPLSELSEQLPLAAFWYRPLLLILSGGLLAAAIAGPGDKT